ncbi:malate transporter [Deltaproteobacteria bacterium]|nr:malate transporter [Deltaproteobacteria bacterium]
MSFVSACSAVMTVFCVGLIGFLLKRKGLVGDEVVKALPPFLTTLVIPPYLVRSITTTFAHDQLLSLLSNSVIPLVSIFFTFLIAFLAAWVCAIRKGRRGTFITAFSTSNSMNIGLPIGLALYGEAAVPYVLLYFFANVVSFWTFGNYMLSRDGEEPPTGIFNLQALRRIFSPPFLGVICGIFLVVCDWQLPVFLDKTFKYFGDMIVGIALMYIGMLMAEVRCADIRLERDICLVFVGRVVVAPLIIVLISRFFPMPPLMFHVFLIQSSLPVMVNLAIQCGYYKGDVAYSAILVSTTTMLAMVTVPFWAIVGGYLVP